MPARTLYAHQDAAIARLRAALREGSKRPLLMMPTGAGKTVISAEIIRMARRKGSRVIFCVPALELVDQTAEEFFHEGIHDIGVIQANHPMTDHLRPVQIASIHTLAKRQIPPAELVIVDEAHRLHKFVTDWMGRDEWAGVPFIGLSATPWTKGLGRLYDRLIIATTTRELIDKGFLSPFRAFAPAHPDLAGVRIVGGDYHEADLSEAMQRGALVADIVTTWLERAKGLPTFVFGVDRAHAKAIQKQFLAAGVTCGYLDALSTREDRKAVKMRFGKDMPVVSNVGVLTTGIDWDVRCIVLARPTRSEMLFCQMIGRGLRPAPPGSPPKDACVILDHSDTTLRLGFVTDILHETLDGHKMHSIRWGTRVKPLPKECPKCQALRPAGTNVCAECGFVAQPQSGVENVGGEIIELDTKRKAKLNRELTWPEKVSFMAQLKLYGLDHGKKDGWAAWQYRAKTGVWPNDPRVKNCAIALKMEPEVLSWIRSRNIRYAKSKAVQA